jgi:uncharacterized protein (DUF362 family)
MTAGPRPELTDGLVSICQSRSASYPKVSPFHPAIAYPELGRLSPHASVDPANEVYGCVRESLRLLKLDAANYGSARWNPLREFVRPGDQVLIKPNWVCHKHDLNDSWEQLITHGSVIRPIIDYVQLALEGRGAISVADGPMLSSDFSEICRRTGITGLTRYYETLPGAVHLDLLDLRSILFETRDAVILRRHKLAGDPRSGVAVGLGRQSAFHGFAGEGRYYGADYDAREVNRHHHGDVQEYQLSGTAMAANVIIDVPKLKAHHKVGVTMALKGVVGLNCGRNWLPHRTQGTPEQGGDQFQSSGVRQKAESALVSAFERTSLRFPRVVPRIYGMAKRVVGKRVFGKSHLTIRGGGWHGNKTLWRMVHDINRALVYADASGRLHPGVTKRRFCIVDGIVAGEGMGPTSADPIACGVVVAGQNPVAVDVVGAELIGFDHTRIPMLAEAFVDHSLPLIRFGADDIRIASNVATWCGGIESLRSANPFSFAAPLGWIDYIERSVSLAEPPVLQTRTSGMTTSHPVGGLR